MNRSKKLIASATIGYVFGLIGSADIASRIAGSENLRSQGTGNPGAANALGVLGKKWAIFVAVGDVAKGYFAGAAGRALAGSTGANVAATAAVAGHCYPATRGFQGGKGVATSVGQVIATMPGYVPVDLAVALVAGALVSDPNKARKVTTVSSAAWIGSSLAWYVTDSKNPGGPPIRLSHPVAAAISSAIILRRFKEAEASR